MKFTLSILDQSPIPEGSTGAEALRNTVDLARLADSLGYHRYWLAEHHATPALACAGPEVMIPLVAEATRRIRVGSGGIMLPHYSPLKVAETFSMLAGLWPGRIDLGLGRAPGSDARTAFALQRDRRTAAPHGDFPDQLDELLGYLEETIPPGHPFAKAGENLPGSPQAPEAWLLGSSRDSATWAAERGLPYCFADFINMNGAAIVKHYRDAFRATRKLRRQRTAAAVWTICAETDEEAERLASSLRMLMTLLHQGQLIAVPAVEKAEQFLSGLPMLAPNRRLIVGRPERVRAELEEVAQNYGADELLLVNILHDHAKRRRSYELVAEAFGLAK